MKIGIGNDHSALELKAEIIELLKEKGHEVVDYGTNSPESCDYPVYGEKVGRAVASGEVESILPLYTHPFIVRQIVQTGIDYNRRNNSP